MNEIILVESIDRVPMTSSLKIAEVFGKQHYTLMRDIRKTCGELDKLRQVDFDESHEKTNEYMDKTAAYNFVLGTYNDSNGQERPMYYLDKDATVLIIMGFTGQKALRFKRDYIIAFNAMESKIKELELQHKTDVEKLSEMQKEFARLGYHMSEVDEECISMGDFSKLISKHGIEIGRNKLFGWLKSQRILMGDNMPYQRYKQYFTVVRKEAKNGKLVNTTLVNGKGQNYILKKIKKAKNIQEVLFNEII